MARQNFSKEDIGAEVLPILTSGLYRDTLDTIREYIQNAIDANSSQISVVIDPDVVSILDNGQGMDRNQARRSIRLGISDKNPITNVGFRGIGIYSAFNMCNSLEIVTKSRNDSETHRIFFDFESIRKKLLLEQRKRAAGDAPKLYLESLLEESVFVESSTRPFKGDHGTSVVMNGIVSEAYLKLNNWSMVSDYLQNVVPLPFNPEFKFGEIIAARFAREDYRVVPVKLQIGARTENLFRPYTDAMFSHGGIHSPEFFELKTKEDNFGFAWVCVNDARSTFKDSKIRGLLIKKFGFSVADRRYLESFFGRTVYSRRITGEVIVTHPNLIPNAARSDFENNLIRQDFLEILPRFTREVNSWANKIQEDDKARDVLNEVSAELFRITDELPAVQRDRERLLTLNSDVMDISRRLKPHIKRLQQIESVGLEKAQTLLQGAQSFVREGLLSQKKIRRKFEEEVVAAIQRKSLASDANEEIRLPSDAPEDFVSLLDAFALLDSMPLRQVLKYFDENYIRTVMDAATYSDMLRELYNYCEENT